MINTCVIGGRLTADITIRYTQSGKPVGGFTIAADRPNYGDREKQTDFIPCVLWGDRAEKLAQYLVKGKPIVVTGQLNIRSYEDRDGNKRKVAEINVSELRFLPDGKGKDSNNNQQQDNFAEEITFSESEIPF